jgi:hypothetical protein
MTEQEFEDGIAAVREVYPETTLIPGSASERPLRVAPVPIPSGFWAGGNTRLLVVFNLATLEAARPLGYLGPEWTLPGGTAPMNAQPAFVFGEAWQTFSWNFEWSAGLGVLQVVEAYLGRFDDHR